MNEREPPAYGDVGRALEQVSSPLSAAGSHGLLCGMLAVSPATTREAWLAEVMGEDSDPRDLLAREGIRVLERVFDRAQASLASADMGFEPLLPPPEASLMERGRALAEWCDGFLYGLGIAGYDGRSDKGAEEQEFVADVNEIAKLRVTEGGEEDEHALAELIEYIRVGVMLVSRVPVDTTGRDDALH